MLSNTDDPLVCFGVHHGPSARIALEAGCSALYMTGASMTALGLGQADLGFAKLSEMRTHAEMIAALGPSVALIANMDTGFGGPLLFGRAAEEHARAGVAAFHIEDQILQKRCGQFGARKARSWNNNSFE
ncbi:hypothetical protein DOTSEDRAFT_70826 [Dothistroma septosporum NZE10]|uniref:Methylisocitrate lyase n=1 Tax=Dothistroma septosporum (strain NZE10 / CBS 128990) TaxID=675120 RepID=N1PPP8_DOTSN|nr:hypothetical protein DOTSEDRAFT_70826 [Dothistroma septosporum NZE10]